MNAMKKDDLQRMVTDVLEEIKGLRKSGQCKEAERLARLELEKNPGSSFFKNALAWSLYDKCVRGKKEVSQELESAVKEILSLCVQDRYSPYVRAGLALLRAYGKDGAERSRRAALTLGRRLDSSQLSREAAQWKRADGEQMVLPSDYEAYCSVMTKALLETRQYQACLDLAEEALLGQESWQNNGDFWLQYRQAQCLKELGRLEESRDLYKVLLRQKAEWYLHYNLMEVELQQGCLEEALRQGLAAALAFGDADKKVKLFMAMANMYKKMGEATTSLEHMSLVLALRKEHNWAIKEETLRYFEAQGGRLEELPSAELLAAKLKRFWRDEKYKGQERMQGVVLRILPSGKDGLIRGADGRTYYFRKASILEGKSQLALDRPVEFYSEPSYDKKRDRESLAAVQVKVLA